jgi:hypothetical protein
VAFYQVRDGRAAEGQPFGKLVFLLRKLFYLSIFFLICNQSVSFIVVSFDPKLALKFEVRTQKNKIKLLLKGKFNIKRFKENSLMVFSGIVLECFYI